MSVKYPRGIRHSFNIVTVSGFPDATNTGVPGGVTLTPFSGNFTTTSDGQIVDALDVSGAILVEHSNVTVKRCRAWQIYLGRGDLARTTDNCICEDCTVVGDGVTAGLTGINIESFTGGSNINCIVRRCNISGVENGMDMGGFTVFPTNPVVRDNYLHDFAFFGADPHVDGCQCSGVHGLLFEHNYIEGNNPVNSSCLTFGPDSINCTINNNKLHGGTENIYIGNLNSGFRVTNNLMIKSPGWGYVSDTSGTTVYSGNYDENNTPLTLP